MTTPGTSRPATTEISTADVFGFLARVEPGSPAARFREQRPDLTRFSQASYESLLEPETDDGLPRKEREMVALRVALLTPDERLAKWHEDRLAVGSETAATVAAVTDFPAVSPDLTPREVAILRHTDLLTRRPTEAEPSDIEALRVVGLSTLEIVTLSQLIAFVAFQVRVLATLRAFGGTA
jgi:CMD domain protein